MFFNFKKRIDNLEIELDVLKRNNSDLTLDLINIRKSAMLFDKEMKEWSINADKTLVKLKEDHKENTEYIRHHNSIVEGYLKNFNDLVQNLIKK